MLRLVTAVSSSYHRKCMCLLICINASSFHHFDKVSSQLSLSFSLLRPLYPSLTSTLTFTLPFLPSNSHYGAQAVVVSVDPKRVYITSPEAAPKGKYVRYNILSGHSYSNLLPFIEFTCVCLMWTVICQRV